MRFDHPSFQRSATIISSAFIIASIAGAQEGQRPLTPADSEFISLENKVDHGESLAKRHCIACHRFTPPELLTKRSWNFLLTYMGLRMGIDDTSFIKDPDEIETSVLEARRLSLQLGDLIPDAPAMSVEDWKSLRDYYLENAPEMALAQSGKPASAGILEGFSPRDHAYRPKGAITSMVMIDEPREQLLVGDSRNQQLTVLDSNLDVVDHVSSKGSYWVDAIASDNDIYLLSVGDIPGDFIGQRLGKIAHGLRLGELYFPQGMALQELYRPTDIELADLDNDGIEELLVCSFGDEGGDFSVFERQSGSSKAFKSEPVQTLYHDTGPIRCHVHDFNSDGLLDIVLLVSDADEHISLFLNRGGNTYDEKIIVEKHPSWGYVDLQLADVDQDGDMDLLTANGDNVDSDPYNTLKPYHGVRVYLNDGKFNFEEAYFYPMHGCFHIRAYDYDMDGDIDIAASSFYPDFSAGTPENFVYLEQTESLRFTPKHHPSAQSGRWMTMDAGDLDGDGDIDIILGAAYVPLGLTAAQEAELPALMENGPALLYLENLAIE